jgi:predicted membrane channel-forming protein YqfA (hemolysin III family)
MAMGGDQFSDDVQQLPHITIILVISAILTGIRLMGQTSEFYQAIAHCWVGGMFGIFAVLNARNLSGRWIYLWCGLLMTAAEVIAFAAGIGNH